MLINRTIIEQEEAMLCYIGVLDILKYCCKFESTDFLVKSMQLYIYTFEKNEWEDSLNMYKIVVTLY